VFASAHLTLRADERVSYNARLSAPNISEIPHLSEHVLRCVIKKIDWTCPECVSQERLRGERVFNVVCLF